ncbi:MAG: YDG domain-containing protein, partial [Paludibacter sp.]
VVSSTSTLGGAKAGNYTLTQPTGLTGNITAKPLSIGAASIASKVSDGNATSGTVTAGTLSGFVSPETVTVNTAVGTYSDATVENGKTATIAYTLANGTNGGLASNYSLANGSANGDITAASTAVTVNLGTPTLASLSLTAASEVTVSGTGTVTFDANKTVKSVTADTGGKIVVINPLTVTSGVTVAPNATLNLSNTLSIGGDLTLKADQTSTFSVKVGSPMTITGNVKFLKTMDDIQWYFMAFPCNVALSGIKVNGTSFTLGTDLFIKYYSGSNRASNGTGANWIPVVLADDHLTANRGYIFGLPDEVGPGHNVSVITFPLDKDVLKSEGDHTAVPVNYYAALTNVENNRGWNFIGQPYLSKYTSQTGNILNLYRYDGTTYIPYAKNTNDMPDVNPFEAYFTQVSSGLESSGLSFALTSRQLASTSVAVNQSDLVRLNFSTATGTDKTYLIMDDLQSTGYQIGEDLEKMITTGTTIPQVYTVLGGINYANNALPIFNVQSLPIGFYTQTAGSTTISIDASQASSLSKLLLTDNGTSPATVTDLLSSNYTFTAAAGTNNTRFAITAQRIATNNNVLGNDLGETQMTISNSKLLINNLNANSTVRVYDSLGRMIVSKDANSNMMEIKLNVRGIYTVQLHKGTTISTRKIIF